jgi:hypothetical protein
VIRRCQHPDCSIRLRPGNAGSRCFLHGGAEPERIDHRSAPAPATRRRGYDPRRDRDLPPAHREEDE